MTAVYATLEWTLREGDDFVSGRYGRAHELSFDGGAVLAVSSSPHVVPLPWSDAAMTDPEELFVASLSSCHMLWFLHKAREAGLTVRHYADVAEGTLAADARGRQAMTRVILRPAVQWAGATPDADIVQALHHAAHEACFIANSVTAEIVLAPA